MEKRTLKLKAREVTPIEHNNIIQRIVGRLLDTSYNDLPEFKKYHAEMYPRLYYTNEISQHGYYRPDIAIFERSQTNRNGKLIAIIEVENKEKSTKAASKAQVYFSEEINVQEYFIYLYDVNSWERITINPENEEFESSETGHSAIMKIELSDLLLNIRDFYNKYKK